MSKINKPSKVFAGWWTVAACSIVGFLGVGIVGPGLSVFFKPISTELGLTRAVASIASSLQSVGQGISGPVAGWATDRFGPRKIMLIGIALLALGLAAMSLVNSLWSFLVVWGLLVGVGFSFGCTVVTDTAIVRWFVRKSGIAINTKFAVQSLSGLALLPLLAWLVLTRGWRPATLIAALVIAFICIPVVWFAVRPHRPEYYGLVPDGDSAAGSREVRTTAETVSGATAEFSLREATRSHVYWMMIFITYLAGAAAPIMGVHCIPFLTDAGIASVEAATIMSIVPTASIPARLLTGYLVDRVSVPRMRFLMAFGFALQSAGVMVFLIGHGTGMIVVWFVLFGLGAGITQSVQIPLWARYFGRKAYGAILGSTMAMNVPVALVAPVYVGMVYDRSGSYMSVIVALAILTAAAGILACFLHQPSKTAVPAAVSGP